MQFPKEKNNLRRYGAFFTHPMMHYSKPSSNIFRHGSMQKKHRYALRCFNAYYLKFVKGFFKNFCKSFVLHTTKQLKLNGTQNSIAKIRIMNCWPISLQKLLKKFWSLLREAAFNPPLISFCGKVLVKRFSVEVGSSSITSRGFFSWSFCLRNSLRFHSGQVPPFHTRNKSSYWKYVIPLWNLISGTRVRPLFLDVKRRVFKVRIDKKRTSKWNEDNCLCGFLTSMI